MQPEKATFTNQISGLLSEVRNGITTKIQQLKEWYHRTYDQPIGAESSHTTPEQAPYYNFSGGATDPGPRDHNEDYFRLPYTYLDENNQKIEISPELIQIAGRFYIVADGVGGRSAGDMASWLATNTASRVYYEQFTRDPNIDIGTALRIAIKAANEAVLAYAQNNPQCTGMSTTFVGAVELGNTLYIANVGDSRTYLVRGNHPASQQTIDHSWVNEQVASGLLSQQEAQNHPQKNIITRSVGNSPTVEIDMFGPTPLEIGDAVLLCSDGLSNVLNAQQITTIINQARKKNLPPSAICNFLVDAAKNNGAADNITAVLFFHND